MPKVTIFSTPTCVYCNAAKRFFTEHQVPYEEHNVATDLEQRRIMIERSGQMGVPVIFIGDELVVGFDQRRIAQLLKI